MPMNVRSQASIAYAYAVGNLKIKSIAYSNVVNTVVCEVDLLAKKSRMRSISSPGM